LFIWQQFNFFLRDLNFKFSFAKITRNLIVLIVYPKMMIHGDKFNDKIIIANHRTMMEVEG